MKFLKYLKYMGRLTLAVIVGHYVILGGYTALVLDLPVTAGLLMVLAFYQRLSEISERISTMSQVVHIEHGVVVAGEHQVTEVDKPLFQTKGG